MSAMELVTCRSVETCVRSGKVDLDATGLAETETDSTSAKIESQSKTYCIGRRPQMVFDGFNRYIGEHVEDFNFINVSRSRF